MCQTQFCQFWFMVLPSPSPSSGSGLWFRGMSQRTGLNWTSAFLDTLTPWHTHLVGVYCHSSWLPFVLKTELTQVNLALVTMEFRGSRTSLNTTSAPASTLQWTCAWCLIWQLLARLQVRLIRWRTVNRTYGIVFSSIFSLVIHHLLYLSLHAMWPLSWY